MPRPSKVMQLPRETRLRLEARMAALGFAGYEDLARWLEDEEGHRISKTSLHEHGRKLRDRLDEFDFIRLATREAERVAAEYGDAGETLSRASQLAMQSAAWRTVQAVQAAAGEDVDVDLARTDTAARIHHRTTRAAIAERRDQRILREAADVVDEALREGGLSDVFAGDVRRKVLGLAQ